MHKDYVIIESLRCLKCEYDVISHNFYVKTSKNRCTVQYYKLLYQVDLAITPKITYKYKNMGFQP